MGESKLVQLTLITVASCNVFSTVFIYVFTILSLRCILTSDLVVTNLFIHYIHFQVHMILLK